MKPAAPTDDHVFIGEVHSDSFRIRRVIPYRNSFLPIVRGRFLATTRGSEVTGYMMMHPFVIAFMAFWLSGVGFAAWTGVSKSGPRAAAIPAGMFIFGVGLSAGGFFVEASKARHLLRQKLNDEKIA